MTVAAVILAASPESALADADGLPAVRRIFEAAWSGGAMPVIVVSFDPDGGVARALAGAEVMLAEPQPKAVGHPAAQMSGGIEVAVGAVDATDGALLWPARMTWVGPETVTSLIEAHGTDPETLLRPGYGGVAGWPILLPTAHASRLLAVAADRTPDDIVADLVAAGTPVRTLDLGDPGTTIDAGTPRAALPPYEGPAPDPSRAVHEWGADVADRPDEAPLPRPTVVPAPGA